MELLRSFLSCDPLTSKWKRCQLKRHPWGADAAGGITDQVLIYAQRPDTTACAEYDLWNQWMGRYVLLDLLKNHKEMLLIGVDYRQNLFFSSIDWIRKEWYN